MANEINYIVSSLPEYVKNNNELIAKQLAFGTPTIKRMSLQTGIKTSAYINQLATNVPIQAGSGCGFAPNGTATLSQRTIVTGLMKKDLLVCPDTLLGKWPEYEVRIPADQREHLPFEAFLVEVLIDEINKQLEDLVWQAKTSAHSGTDQFDGLLYIINAENTAVKFNIASGVSAYNAIKQVIGNIPQVVMRKSPKIFVSPEFFVQLSLELVEKNLFHFKPDGNIESLVFPGTNIEVYDTPGLASQAKIVCSYRENLIYGTDVEGAEQRVKVVYDEVDDAFKIKFRWNSGVQVAFPDHCVLATLQGTVVSPDANAQLATIAANTGTIATAAGKVAESVNTDHQIETHNNA